jgi:hypothetical protein
MARSIHGRSFGRRPRRKTALIICGGTATEPMYLEALKQRLRLGGVLVRGIAKDPDTLIEEAVAIRKRHERDGNEPYDATWLVVDSERPGTFNVPAVLQHAEANNVETAFSCPSFELWLLLHHEFTTASFDNAQQVQQRLLARDPGFAKAKFAVRLYLDRMSQALLHARQLKEYRQQAGAVSWQTSGTDVDKLILWMRSISDNRIEADYSR